MSKKMIAITQRLIAHEQYFEIREALSSEWGILFNKGHIFDSFLPLPLSYNMNFQDYLSSLGDRLAGVILSGGNDLSCCMKDSADDDTYLAQQKILSQQRDSYEKTIIQCCIAHRIALLGICRGAQMIAWHFGSNIERCKDHVGLHEIIYTQDARTLSYAQMQNKQEFSQQSFVGNSFHNYCITKLGKQLVALATSTDNTIESFRHKKYPIFGIVWHIERKNGWENNCIVQEWLNTIIKLQNPYSN
ncbi:gamma-glutamyl-gamma-aminobutyrate hydrolase [Helicobacter aurati]|uniref:Gamma-glutamyl-gamma-aminobutyrate hydrolase n=1 Tax=Helicobacter aurati TaxID=137778 RepID=A0A3D8J7A0_9HELI|nr:gamma-glutamyl-gamma-aminobutyrate hydrolase family protein [Helicobacter aurati]RDU73377.1 gamma-glutamyl-gamma-aminobutyrate hydrolase [Helicobacter aurati]